MAFEPTKEQSEAIETAGNILVSAAAGSGKTAVLVERVIKKLCAKENGVSADKLLIVTFTNAAAAEMRSRIEKRLEEEIINNPSNTSLIVQKHLLQGAKICTIDSFCIDLVRENFEKLDVSPDFKVDDGNTLRATDEKVIRQIVNRLLSEKNTAFENLLDIVGSEYDESNFIEFVLDIYNYSRQLPFPKDWFNRFEDLYKEGNFNENNLWYKYAFEKAQKVTENFKVSLANAIDLLTVNEKAANSYMPVFVEASLKIDSLHETAKSNDWDAFFNALQEFSLPKIPIVRGVSDIYEITAAKDIYKYIGTKACENIKKIFFADYTFITEQFLKLSEPIGLLAQILIEFDDELFEEYKRINTFTFHNTEHLALKLLCNYKDGKIIMREDTLELVNRYEEVMVDEYQDTNDLQNMLFYVLSNREENLFSVGDVKQSIYGFRGANPQNFLIKKQRYIPLEEASAKDPKKIILGKNFRCKPEVCDFINFVFSQFMTESTGDIVYSEGEELIPAAEYPFVEGISTEICFVNTKGSNLNGIQAEAVKIAEYINNVMSSGEVIREDKDILRKARYSDFTILLRSAKLKAPPLAEELKKFGIPVTYTVEDFAGSTEISVMLSLLTVVDNPRSDIDLLTVMMSSIFGFNCEELSQIRISKRDGCFYGAVVQSAENGNLKAEKFLNTLEKYRLKSAINPLDKFIDYLLSQSGYVEITSAMTDGLRRKNNLLLLSDYAKQYCENSNGSLKGFVNFIKKQSEVGMKSAATVCGSDSVKIMSIHASKGLQFPVCIVSSLATNFNDSESRGNSIYTTDFGIGFKYYDETDKTRYTTVGREVILDKIRSERLCEELRLLYVALTRTQDKLFLTASMSDVYKKSEELKTLLISESSKITSGVFARTKSYSDWLILALLLHPCGKELRGNASSLQLVETMSNIKVTVTDAVQPENAVSILDEEEVEIDYSLAEKIKQNINYKYPYQEIAEVESKASVSRLVNSAESSKYAFTGKPSFMSDGAITPAERGTAMHKVMEFFDFDKSDDIKTEIERLYEWQYISEREYESLNVKKLEEFFNSNLFARIKKADLLKREMRFITEIPAKSIKPDLSADCDDENVIVQGAVDVCFIEPDGLVILDFKTDRVEEEDQLRNAYGEQLNVYAYACEKIFGKKVKQKIIYSFNLSKEIEI